MRLHTGDHEGLADRDDLRLQQDGIVVVRMAPSSIFEICGRGHLDGVEGSVAAVYRPSLLQSNQLSYSDLPPYASSSQYYSGMMFHPSFPVGENLVTS